MMKITTLFSFSLLATAFGTAAANTRGAVAATAAATATAADADADTSLIQQRRLDDDIDVVRVSIGTKTVIDVTTKKRAANGAVVYGVTGFVLTPNVCGDKKVECQATASSGLLNTVDMQFAMRKALRPDTDENGEPKDYDCQASSDTNFVSPDTETCSVGNFIGCPVGDVVYGGIVILDNGMNLDKTYSVNLLCNEVDIAGGGGGCFPEDAAVIVHGKGKTQMKDLQVGDHILTSTSPSLTYEPVYAFAHHDKKRSAEYLQIYTDAQEEPLEVTKDHLLLVNEAYVPADKIQVGDHLSHVAKDDKNSAYAVVNKIKTTTKKGLYAPLVPSGTLLVNNIKTSSYISLPMQEELNGNVVIGGTTTASTKIDTQLSFHFIQHMALSPIRLACMGISSQFFFCDNQQDHDSSNDSHQEETGYPVFVTFWFQLVGMFRSQSSLCVQVFMLLAFVAVVGPLYVAESLLGGPAYAPIVMLVLAVTVPTFRKHEHEDKLNKAIQQ